MPITAIVNIDGTSLLGGQKMVCLHVSSRKQAISCRAFGQFVSELCLSLSSKNLRAMDAGKEQVEEDNE